METELKETIQNLLLQFMQNMHEWEVMCNDIAKQSKLSFEEQFNKQKEGKNRIAVHTYREVPLRQKKQYIFLYSKGKWLLDSKKRYSVLKQKWLY